MDESQLKDEIIDLQRENQDAKDAIQFRLAQP